MGGIKLLIDTNVVFGAEDAKEIDVAYSEFIRRCNEKHLSVFVHESTYDDVARDQNLTRRAITLSKLQKFQQLRGIRLPDRSVLEAEFGPIGSPNDEADVALLVALHAQAVDFLVTQDAGLHRRAERANLGGRIFTVQGALAWIRQTFDPAEVRLPYIEEKIAHEIDRRDEIFDSLREGYPNFDAWFAKCVNDHRRCWTITIGQELAGIVVRKENEPHAEAGTAHCGPKILKICTFKVKPKFRGEKFGEQLLKQILWFAQKNLYDLTYLTAYPKENFLLELLHYYGFEHTKDLANGEWVLEKPLARSRIALHRGDDPLSLHRRFYPRFSDDAPVQAFCVPIQGEYHRTLFPEIAFMMPLPLFPTADFAPVLPTGASPRLPGNTIRKVYVCRAPTTAINPGDILLFYMSKSSGLVGSQSITTVGIAERVSVTMILDDLLRLTAKRSVFSAAQLKAILDMSNTPVKIVDFLLAGHLDPPINLAALIDDGIFKSPPQSITKLPTDRYARLKTRIDLGFEL